MGAPPSPTTTAALARQRKGDSAGAIRDYDRAIELNPHLAYANQNRGAIRYRQGELDVAIGDFSKAIEINPRDMNDWVNRGSARGNQPTAQVRRALPMPQNAGQC